MLLCKAGEVNLLANPGRGVTVIKVEDDDRVIGFGIARGKHDKPFAIESAGGKQFEIGPSEQDLGARGGKGHRLQKTTFKLVPPAVRVTTFTPPEVN